MHIVLAEEESEETSFLAPVSDIFPEFLLGKGAHYTGEEGNIGAC
jgi:hypothetical protein